MLTDSVLRLLRAARSAEKEQTLFYRALSAQAEERGDPTEIDDLNGLLADEQHHLSRLSARMVELGYETGEVHATAPSCDLNGWRIMARERERAEVSRYEELLEHDMDEETAGVLRSILATEREQEANLGGKYTEA